jgi:GNAT superfamily N-acetyltransferase
MEVHPLTAQRLPDLADLFESTAMTRRCHCTYVLLSGRTRETVWREGRSRAFFEEASGRDAVPLGVLAYADGRADGWCAVGPRSRYSAVLRSPLWKERDEAEDDEVWLVACFYVRSAARHAGVMSQLLDGAVALARQHGAVAIEGMPRARGERVDAASSLVGFESVFSAAGFDITVGRPSRHRVLVRREL